MHQLKRIAQRITVVLAWLYCLVVLYFTFVWSLLPERIWWISVTNLFAPLFFLPTLLFLPAAALLRTRRMALAVAIPLVVFVALFGGLFVPRFPAVAAHPQQLRVVSLNHFVGNQRVNDVVQALAATDADVIALQELSPGVAAAIEAQLAERYPHRWLLPATHAGGLGLLSRHPFAERASLIGGRGQRATLELASGPVTIVNVHLHFNSISRRSVEFWGDIPILKGYDTRRLATQAELLLAGVADVESPLILLGDFNLGDREPAYRLLRAELRDAFREAGWGFGFTFPNHKRFGPITVPAPVVRLDYVWLGGPLAARHAAVDCRPIGADHCMLVVDLEAATP